MFPTYRQAATRPLPSARPLTLAAVLVLLALAAAPARAQNTLNSFSSGSTGADGAFEPTSNQTVVVPESGVFNFTTVNIPAGVQVTFLRNAKNRPVTILATGNVVIAGTILVDGRAGNNNGGGGSGGAGGFDGGSGGYPFDSSFIGVSGDGPGGGTGGPSTAVVTIPGGGGGGGYAANGSNGSVSSTSGLTAAAGGPRYGAATLVPLIGGSGGGGGGARSSGSGGAGGGGGGAVLVASSGSITFNGAITARGGAGSTGAGGGGGGAGGAIRLVSNTLVGTGNFLAHGGNGGGSNVSSSANGGTGAPGFIRVEAYDYTNFNPSSNPGFISFALPHPVTAPNAPTLRVASVAGINAPANPLGSLHGVPDVVVPTTQPNPVTVAIAGANIPLGTVVTVTLTPAQGPRTTTQSGGLAGTEAASTASANISLPAGMSVLSATATIDLTSQSASARPPLFMDGERVDRIEVAATFGGVSEATYVTRSGRRIRRVSE